MREKGWRPSFTDAAEPGSGQGTFNDFSPDGVHTVEFETGIFQAHMDVNFDDKWACYNFIGFKRVFRCSCEKILEIHSYCR